MLGIHQPFTRSLAMPSEIDPECVLGVYLGMSKSGAVSRGRGREELEYEVEE